MVRYEASGYLLLPRCMDILRIFIAYNWRIDYALLKTKDIVLSLPLNFSADCVWDARLIRLDWLARLLQDSISGLVINVSPVHSFSSAGAERQKRAFIGSMS